MDIPARIKLISEGTSSRLYIDGKEILAATSVIVDLDAGELPRVTVELIADVEFEGDAVVEKTSIK